MQNDSIKFYLVSGIPKEAEANSCYLTFIKWNDYGFYTSFHLNYITKKEENVDLGRVRIMHMGMINQESDNFEKLNIKNFIPQSFETLDENFCSLGGQAYYETLALIPEKNRKQILASLRDCAFNPVIFERFFNEPAMRESLLRDVDEQKVRVLFPSIIRENIELSAFSFRFLLKKDPTLSINVNVVPKSTPPSNIHVLIGSNGVGKTRIISGIMDQLTKISNPISQEGSLEFVNDTVGDTSEKFANLVIVVFSAFDHFVPPPINNKNKDSISAQYIGLKKDDGKNFKSPDSIGVEFEDSIKVVSKSSVKSDLWRDIISKLNSDQIFDSYELNRMSFTSDEKVQINEIFKNLSSGHRIVLLTITRLVELVDEKTLVLIDEPENHLHPPLLSSFVRALSDLLIKRNGVAVIATHSPVVLQEVPSYCVTIVDRVGDEFDLYRPQLETYAENIDTLTREIFGLELENSGFYKEIKDKIYSSPNYSYEEFLNEFNHKVGSEGRALAKSMLTTKRNKDA